MNYELEVGQSNPAVFNTLNGGRPPLVAGSGSSSLLTTITNTTFAPFNKGYEDTPFTLEVWFLPLTNTGEVVVIGHDGEGVIWDGSKFIIRVKQGDGSVVTESSWTPFEVKAFHVVMVYSPGQARLYIDGEVVASLELQRIAFATTAQPVSINRGTSTATYDSLALYYRPLTSAEIKAHYSWGNDIPDAREIAAQKKGTTWTLAYDNIDVFDTLRYDSENFAEGFFDGALMLDGILIGPGVWRQSYPLASLVGDTTAGIHLTYDGAGVNLSYSLDGSTWTPIPNMTTILEDATVTGSMLLIQAELIDENSKLNSLTVDVLRARELEPYSGNRMITFKSASFDQSPGNQLDYHNDWGAILRSGYLEIRPDQLDTPTSIFAIEMWAKLDDASGFLLGNTSSSYVNIVSGSATISGMTVYRNGVPFSNGTAVEAGQWSHWLFVLTTPTNEIVRIGQNIGLNSPLDMTVGHLATYGRTFSASDAQRLYNLNIGAPALRVTDASAIGVTEPAPTVSIWAKSWSITSATRG